MPNQAVQSLLDQPLGPRAKARPGNQLGLLERWYALQPQPRVLALVLELNSPCELSALRNALQTLQTRYPRVLASTLARTQGTLHWQRLRDPPCPLRVDTSSAPGWLLAQRALHEPFPWGAPLWQLHVSADRKTLVASFQHTVTDALGAYLLVKELYQTMRGDDLAAPAVQPAYPQLESCLDLRPTLRQFLPKAHAPDTPGTWYRGPGQVDSPLRTHIHHSWLECAVRTQLQQQAKRAGTTLHGALCAAALSATATFQGTWPLTARIACPISLRKYLTPMPTGPGLYLCGFQSDHIVHAKTPFWQWAARYSADLRAQTPIAQRDLGLLTWLPNPGALARTKQRSTPNARTATFEVSNLGKLPPVGPDVRLWFCQGNHYHGPIFNLSVVSSGEHHPMAINLAVPSPVITTSAAQAFLAHLHHQLHKAALRPETTLG